VWNKTINEEHCGICSEPNNFQEIVNAIQYLIKNPEEVLKMGQNGRKAIERKYNWGTQEIILLDIYKGLLCR
jgi:glycosyltransferase involved in cell wall biosynthesis